MTQTGSIHRDWLEIADFYGELAAGKPSDCRHFGALAGLCRAVAASHLGGQLYAHTSVTSLWISQTARQTDWHSSSFEFLTITPTDAGLLFELRQSASARSNWQRCVDAGNLVSSFNRFLEQLGWNHHPIEETPENEAPQRSR